MTNPDEQVNGSQGSSNAQVGNDPEGQVKEPSWFEKVPEEYRSNNSIASLKDKGFDEFVKDYVNKDSLVGKKGVILPNKDDEGDVKRFYSELGVPESIDKYSEVPIEVPENIQPFMNMDKVDTFKDLAHKYNLTDDQYKGILKDYMDGEISTVNQTYEEQVKGAEEAKTALRTEWGEKTDERIANAQKMIDAFADEKSYEFFNNNNKDVGLIRFLDSISQKVSQDSIRSDGAAPVQMTKEAAQKRMTEILDSEDYWVGVPKPGTKSLREEYIELGKIVG